METNIRKYNKYKVRDEKAHRHIFYIEKFLIIIKLEVLLQN